MFQLLKLLLLHIPIIYATDVKLNIPDDDYSNKNHVSRQSSGTDDEISEGGFISLHLHPTVQLSKIHNNNEKRRLDLLNDFEEQEYKHAIYAPLHHFLSTNDDDVENNAARIMEEFEQYRQISRFERNYQSQHKKEHKRRKLQIDKQQQTVPLFQGYGTHYSTVWVGSPQAQRKTVIVDTGSHYTAFPCVGCDNCGEEHHTDKLFDPSLSQTFRKLECPECKDNAMCSMMEGQGQGLPPNDRACIFRQSYTEGSSWTAYQAIDNFYCGTAHGHDDDDQNQKQGIISEKKNNVYNQNFAIPFMFGCQISETGLFVTQLADGIMGMSKNDNTLIKHMYDAGVVPKKQFSLCFKREAQVSKDGILAGIFTLGGSDLRLRQQTIQQDSKSEISWKKMRYAKNISDTGWYTVNIRNIFLRKGGGISTSMNNFEEGAATTNNQPIIKLPIEKSNLSGGKGVIIDSGTTDTYFPQALRADFHKIWHDATGLNYSNRALKLSREQVEKLPTLLIQMEAYYDSQNNSNNNDHGVQSLDDGLAGNLDFINPKDILLAVPAIHYMEYSPSKKTYTSRLYFTETSGGVIGANAMQGHDVLFDWEQPRIGFVESSCNYEELGSSSIANDVADPLPNDGEPPLTKTTTTQTKNENDSREKCVLSQPQRGDEGCEDIVKKIFERYCTVSRPGSFMLDMVDETYIFEILESERSTNVSNKCEDAAKEVIPEASSVNCDTKQCVIKKKCQISCDDVWDMSADTQRPVVKDHDQNHLGNLATNETPKNTNCQEPWSLCSAQCTQTKPIKVQKEDGSCEFVDNSVRPCHIDACHGSCIVPYVLHVVVGLTNIDPSHWTKRAEEAFIESFVSPLPRIEPGDVDVVFVNVMKNGETEEMGLKLVLEISVFSQKAENANSSSSSSPCSYSDPNELYSLARIASGIHEQIQSESYVTTVLQKMPLTQYVTSSNTITSTIQNSKVLSSITVDVANGNNHDHSKDEQLLSLNNNKNSQYIQNGISQMNPNETVVMDNSSSSNYFLSTGQSVAFMIFTAFALASYFRHRRRVAQSTNIISPRRRIRQRSRGKYSKVTINDSGDIEMA